MKALLFAAAIAILSAPASAGTIKAVWNQSLDYPANAEARLTPTDGCLGRSVTLTGQCYNDRERVEEIEEIEEDEKH